MKTLREMMDRINEIDTTVNPEELAHRALNEAVRYIQDELGQEYGDFAGMFFTGQAEDTIQKILAQYIKEEMANMEQERSGN